MRSSSNESSQRGHENPHAVQRRAVKNGAALLCKVSAHIRSLVRHRVERAARCELARGSEETETCLCGPTLRLCPPLQIPLLLCISNLQVSVLVTMFEKTFINCFSLGNQARTRAAACCLATIVVSRK